ncbi:MAG: divergent PAP2 family protein [Clostridia bacterium]|nr:divergent PAP2 family protein [Clostridia bacterium]
MNWFYDMITNPFLVTGISSWLIAQVLKTIIHAIINKKIDCGRLMGDGGMPSGHSATVTSLMVMTGLQFGTASFEFALAFLFATVVCHDAMGVRLETGKQAVLLNDLVEAFEIFTSQDLPEVKLKEFVGHTPIQVFAGVFLGGANAFLMNYLLG